MSRITLISASLVGTLFLGSLAAQAAADAEPASAKAHKATVKQVKAKAKALKQTLASKELRNAASKYPAIEQLFDSSRPLLADLARKDLPAGTLDDRMQQFNDLVTGSADSCAAADPSCAQRCKNELDACIAAIPPGAKDDIMWFLTEAAMCTLVFEACVADCLLPG